MGASKAIGADHGSIKSITDRDTLGFIVPACEKKKIYRTMIYSHQYKWYYKLS